MTPEQFDEFIKANEESTARAIEKTVNGKIRVIKDMMEHHITEFQEFKSEMMPIREGIHTVQTLNKFIKWLGFPAIGAFIMWLLYNK